MIKGNIKEDEQAAFELVCKRTGKEPGDAKGVGYFNRLIKLCSITGLSIKLDYSNDVATFIVDGLTVPVVIEKAQQPGPTGANPVTVKRIEEEDTGDDPFA